MKPQELPLKEEKLLNKKNLIRLVIVGVLIAIAVSAFSFGVGKLISAESGYRTVECTANVANCSSDFIFTYNLGVSGISPTVELKAVTNLYNEKAPYYYRLFHPTEQFEDMNNVASLNAGANTELKVPDELYAALEKASADEGRNVFLAPFFAYYDTLYSSTYDEDAATWDPQRNPELAAEYEKTLSFVTSDEHIRLELNGEGKVVLRVSGEYLEYAEEVGITSFIDFGWTKNAFIADGLASDMISAGYTHGVISSRDGYIRNMDAGGTEYAFDIFDERDGYIRALGKLIYTGDAAICSLHQFILDETEAQMVYKYGDGTRVTRYVSAKDALSHGQGAAVVYSKDSCCADILLSVLPYYLDGAVQDYTASGVGVIYSDGQTVHTIPLDGFEYAEN